MIFAEKTLECRDCTTAFTFSADEQEFFASEGYTKEPGRCQSCREALDGYASYRPSQGYLMASPATSA
jgi:hypothetical protein